MGQFVWWMEPVRKRGGLRCVWEDTGELCAVMDGQRKMRWLCADKLDMTPSVSVYILLTPISMVWKLPTTLCYFLYRTRFNAGVLLIWKRVWPSSPHIRVVRRKRRANLRVRLQLWCRGEKLPPRKRCRSCVHRWLNACTHLPKLRLTWICSPKPGGIPDYYFVEISTSPSEGPFAIYSEVTLHCSVSPYPHGSVTYQWTTSVPGVSITHEDTSTPNVTVTIPAGHTKYGYYYCVVQSNNSTLASGFVVLEIQGMEFLLIITTVWLFKCKYKCYN